MELIKEDCLEYLKELIEKDRFKLSQGPAIAKKFKIKESEILSYVSLLSGNKKNQIEIEYRDMSGKEPRAVKYEEFVKKLTLWWREKKISDKEWYDWSSNIEVSWISKKA